LRTGRDSDRRPPSPPAGVYRDAPDPVEKTKTEKQKENQSLIFLSLSQKSFVIASSDVATAAKPPSNVIQNSLCIKPAALILLRNFHASGAMFMRCDV
jgi:hypothetical protein